MPSGENHLTSNKGSCTIYHNKRFGQPNGWGVRVKKERRKKMKKNITKKTAKKTIAKAMLVKPTKQYSRDEVRSILGLSKGSNLSPKHYPTLVGETVSGAAIIARLERASAKNAKGRPTLMKIGRRYASGTVTVVAR